jgi:hypothetical protein
MNPLYVVILAALIIVCAVNLLRTRDLLGQVSYTLVLVPLTLRVLGIK